VGLLRRRESSFSYLVVGLGNPGPRYRDTRHNLGRRAVELVASELGGSWRSRWNGRASEVRDGDERLMLLVPETFMNDSGRSVAPALRFAKLPPERLVVVHDELDLPIGDVRAKRGGGLAGHNGLRSVADALGTQDFLRVRIGIGRPERGDPRPVADWPRFRPAPTWIGSSATRRTARSRWCGTGWTRRCAGGTGLGVSLQAVEMGLGLWPDPIYAISRMRGPSVSCTGAATTSSVRLSSRCSNALRRSSPRIRGDAEIFQQASFASSRRTISGGS
jgi:PTH1 family peptidyl-tRNA hydrolase